MKKYNYYINALIISVFYNLLKGNLHTYSYFANIGWIVGILLIPYIISMIIEALFKKEVNFDKIFMWTTLVFCFLSLIANIF